MSMAMFIMKSVIAMWRLSLELLFFSNKVGIESL
jgi:hypothetical protein